jgi:hypothetical protein
MIIGESGSMIGVSITVSEPIMLHRGARVVGCNITCSDEFPENTPLFMPHDGDSFMEEHEYFIDNNNLNLNGKCALSITTTQSGRGQNETTQET